MLAIVVLLIEVIVGFTAINLSKEKFHHTMRDSFNTTVAMTENFFSLVGQMGSVWGAHLILDGRLNFVKKLRSSSVSRELISHFKDESNADVIIILDSKGRVVRHSEKDELRGDSLMSWQMVRKALSNKKIDVSVIQDMNNLIIYSPNIIYEKNNGSIIGMVLVGYVINDELISGMKKDTLTDITIVRRRGVMASTYNTEKKTSDRCSIKLHHLSEFIS